MISEAWNYWTKTPDVLSNAWSAVGFGANKINSVLPQKAPYVSKAQKAKQTTTALRSTHGEKDIGGASFAENSMAYKIANNPITNVANALSVTKKTTVIRDGEFVRQNQILNGIGATADAIDETVLGASKAVFGSSTFWKVAILAGGAYAIYKFGGEFVSQKGAQLARR